MIELGYFLNLGENEKRKVLSGNEIVSCAVSIHVWNYLVFNNVNVMFDNYKTLTKEFVNYFMKNANLCINSKLENIIKTNLVSVYYSKKLLNMSSIGMKIKQLVLDSSVISEKYKIMWLLKNG